MMLLKVGDIFSIGNEDRPSWAKGYFKVLKETRKGVYLTEPVLPYTFVYTDETRRVEYFANPREAAEFAQNEGDHLIGWSAGDWRDE